MFPASSLAFSSLAHTLAPPGSYLTLDPTMSFPVLAAHTTFKALIQIFLKTSLSSPLPTYAQCSNITELFSAPQKNYVLSLL